MNSETQEGNPLPGWSELDGVFQRVLERLCRKKRGESRIDFSRRGKNAFQAFILPDETVVVTRAEVSCRQEVESFIETVSGRFSNARKHILRHALNAWGSSSRSSMVIKTEKRSGGPDIDLGNECWEKFDDN